MRSAETVNGSITVGAGAEVQQGIEAVNGSLTLRPGARVRGGLENVNGAMLLEGAQVAGGIETVNGDIRLAARHAPGGRHPRREDEVEVELGRRAAQPAHHDRAGRGRRGPAALRARSRPLRRAGRDAAAGRRRAAAALHAAVTSGSVVEPRGERAASLERPTGAATAGASTCTSGPYFRMSMTSSGSCA